MSLSTALARDHIISIIRVSMEESLVRHLLGRHLQNLTAPSMADKVPDMAAKFLDLSSQFTSYYSSLTWFVYLPVQFVESFCLFHLRLGSILMMMIAVVNDGLRNVDGMEEPLVWIGFLPLLD